MSLVITGVHLIDALLGIKVAVELAQKIASRPAISRTMPAIAAR